MDDLNDINKKLGKFTDELKKSLKTMNPQIEGCMRHIQEATKNMQPKYMKHATINNKAAKLILMNDNAIRIEFDDATDGEKQYNEWQ